MPIQHYHGGCQCGAVKYEVDADLDRTITCNCSRCQKLGSVLTFTPADRFTLLSGGQYLTEYLFNKHAIRHLFCKVCGIESFARGAMPDGSPMVAVNANCLDGVEPRELKSHHYDGRSK
jgi:hypothetical protein